MPEITLTITHGQVQTPAVVGDIKWETQLQAGPGRLEFTCLKTPGLNFQEGDPVQLALDGELVFYGYVFEKSRSKDQQIKVIAYDQVRYLKNKDTIFYEGKTADRLLAMLAADHRFRLGACAATGYVIPSRIEKDTALLDMLQTALDLTLQNTGKRYLIYDDGGFLTLRDVEDLQLPLVLWAQSAEDFDYTSSIDKQTYNRVKLTYQSQEGQKWESATAQNDETIDAWGVLQYCENQTGAGVNLKAKADALLALYNRKTRNLSVKGVFGHRQVRGGSSLIVQLDLGDIEAGSRMVVEKATHSINKARHTMDLTLIGGDFIA